MEQARLRWMGTRREDLRNRLASNDELHNTDFEHLSFFKFIMLICSIYLSFNQWSLCQHDFFIQHDTAFNNLVTRHFDVISH